MECLSQQGQTGAGQDTDTTETSRIKIGGLPSVCSWIKKIENTETDNNVSMF